MTAPADYAAVAEASSAAPTASAAPADSAGGAGASSATSAPPDVAAVAPHDSPPPKALLDFMLRGWAPATHALPSPIDHAEAFARRRSALSTLFPGETLVVPSGHLKVRSNDTHYRFRPSSDFYYLTGDVEPDCVLVLTPGDDGLHRSVLFVEPNPGHEDATFFTDRVKGALWVGARLGVPESRARFGVDECQPLQALAPYLADLARSGRRFRARRRVSDLVDGALAPSDRDVELATTLAEMRLIKDDVEIGELRSVIASTRRGFEDVIKRLRKGSKEREVEGIFALRARVEGNDVGYGTIAAAGAHACVLHYRDNSGDLTPGKLLLLDAGVEGNSLYTADITRTLPIDGSFSKAQRAIYKLVHKAQRAALAEVKPGNDFMDPNRAAMKVLAEGLEKLKLLPGSASDALREDQQLYKRFTLHNVSHMLGLDVHDCAEARKETYKLGKLRPGMVLTVEPGLYFQEDDLTVPEAYRGIGVRIEDDVLVTENGHENLSADIPSQIDEVEAWMAKIWRKGGKKR